jgi:hypothetical protein
MRMLKIKPHILTDFLNVLEQVGGKIAISRQKLRPISAVLQ